MEGTGDRRAAPRVDDREGVMLLGDALRSAAYEPARMRPMLRARDEDNITPQPIDVPVILRLLPKGDRLAGLMKLFLMRLAVPEQEAREALAPLALERAVRIEVVRRDNGAIRSNVRILPAGKLLFASDLEAERSADLAPDHVMGVAASSIFLASLTVRKAVSRALDVGAGGGIQSVVAAMHADKVIACDINPRALRFTAFNALLNRVDNIECRQGSFFDPVAGETFDLIVSNPPFVISPANAITFRDSGLRGDAVSRQMLRQAVTHLAPGGRAFVLINWGIRQGQDWREPLREWVADLPCDVWILRHSTETALLYAAGWNASENDPAKLDRAIERWNANLVDLGYATIGYGAAILRRRSAPLNWLRFDDLGGQRAPASGDVVEQLIAAQDYIAGLADDRDLLTARMTLVREHRLDQVLRARDGTFAVEAASLRLETGLRFETEIDAFSAQVLAHLDGRTLDAAIHAAAAKFPSDGIAYAEFETAALQFGKKMLALGFVRLVTD